MNTTQLTFRDATRDDLAVIIAMLVDDVLGSTRGEIVGETIAAPYVAAFEAINADANSRLIVAEIQNEGRAEIVGTLQLTIVPGLAYRGASRAIIEGVRIAAPYRKRRFGEQLIRHAIALAKADGARIVQLTTNKARKDAQRFYSRIGFENSHEGFKLGLD